MNLSQLRKDAITIFHAGLKVVYPVNAVKRHFNYLNNILTVGNRTYSLSDFRNIYVIGAGKASAAMAQPIEQALGNRLSSGIVNVKYGYSVPLKVVRINEAGHPEPDEAGLNGTKEITKFLEQTDKEDLVIFLISGGGSALLPFPFKGLTLLDKQETTKILLKYGATIHEINTVRKHISQVKGGRLARLAYPSMLVSLILSDVIGDDLDVIASGPTVPDHSTFNDCLHILEKYNLYDKIPPSVLMLLEKGARGEIEETLKVDDPVFKRTQNVIIGSNILAVKAAKKKADELGYHSLILSTFIEGETREIAKIHTAIVKEIISTGHPLSRPACIISGGETTVTIRGNGLGGRNQEFVLAAAMEVDGLDNTVILSAGTDGTDGPTDAAGAIADGSTVHRAHALGLNPEHYLKENDSYHFFKPLGDLFITGPTNTNVMDLRLALIA